MNNENIQDSLKMISELKGSLDKLLKVQAQSISHLPPEYSSELAFAIKDINTIKTAIKKGDTEKLNELTKRYAHPNNSN